MGGKEESAAESLLWLQSGVRASSSILIACGDLVEVAGVEEGLRGSHHLATVLRVRRRHGNWCVTIRYQHLVEDEKSMRPLCEDIMFLVDTGNPSEPLLQRIRPACGSRWPHTFRDWVAGDRVEVFAHDAYWEGRALEVRGNIAKVSFPGEKTTEWHDVSFIRWAPPPATDLLVLSEPVTPTTGRDSSQSYFSGY